MRTLHKTWRNGPGGKWTARIRWYEGLHNDIRLAMEDQEQQRNIYPRSREEAEIAWNLFMTEQNVVKVAAIIDSRSFDNLTEPSGSS